MKVAIIGGGPAGLYAAILLKKQRPQAEITVYERNRADDTFGFGVVFSRRDARQFREVRSAELPPHHPGIRLLGRHRRAFPRHGAPRRRQRLLRLLAPHAAADPAGARPRTRRDAAVRDRYRRRSRFADADLVVLADGINSRFRDKIRRSLPARGRPALQQIRLDGLDQAARCLHLHLPGDRVGAVHRPRLPV